MKRFGLAVLMVGCLLFVAARSVSAQGVRWGPMVGVLMPMGDYNTIDKMGWVVGLGVTKWMTGGMLGLRVDGSYSTTSHDGFAGNTKIMGGMASVVYGLAPPDASARPLLTGGVGLYNVDGGGSETKIGFGFGAAVAFKMGTGSTRLVVATRFTSVSTTPSLTFLPITVGLSFGK
jgi:hypothetical protein